MMFDKGGGNMSIDKRQVHTDALFILEIEK